MATQAWQPGRLYPPGSLVVARTRPSTPGADIQNPGFELGDVGWSKGGNWVINNNPGFTGAWCAQFSGTGTGELVNLERAPVVPGRRINAECYIKPATGSDAGRIRLYWYDGGGSEIRRDDGTLVQGSGGWRLSRISAAAPAGSVTVAIGVSTTKTRGTTLSVDAFSWDYVGTQAAAGLMYKAVQPATGYSGTAEPAWPVTLGLQVIDNEVIWEAVSIARVVWEARPILLAGGAEPDWPTQSGARVADGTISWEAVSRRIEDPNCPTSKVTTIIASKVFKADGDIVRFSATANPRDWTTTQDAGYLPTGLQQANANDAAVLATYRGNLAAFNASSFQMWQVDPDPEAMAILDQMDGIGSSWQKAAQPVANDLFYLSQLGVRTVGIANAAENLAAGDVGSPVDDLIRAELALGGRIVSTYYPGAGQFWLAFAREAVTSVHVYTMSQLGRRGAWSRYEFPFSVEAFAQLGDDLYIRHGNAISIVSEAVSYDEASGGDSGIEQIPFPGLVWWPWLDFGTPGQTKMLEAFDYVGTGQGPSISVGYDQRSLSAFTPGYQLVSDTMPGGMVPIPVAAPTLSVRLAFAGGQKWNVQSVLLSVLPMQGGP